ncbi:hypothetical protein C9374_003881 [Naegleria lovaniensis]|uniref:Uncharacterized protein n=1 Tax=Naegleria lovaniensis TaxID=51637 RepID=A0AA88KSF3_NAELO|nr:uncharacterized protein C9374_003881 [Naegleria lovaniensis]KAG2394117.1 hypothetical protein C9374_003881 [Naegleria lovaniensis]
MTTASATPSGLLITSAANYLNSHLYIIDKSTPDITGHSYNFPNTEDTIEPYDSEEEDCQDPFEETDVLESAERDPFLPSSEDLAVHSQDPFEIGELDPFLVGDVDVFDAADMKLENEVSGELAPDLKDPFEEHDEFLDNNKDVFEERDEFLQEDQDIFEYEEDVFNVQDIDPFLLDARDEFESSEKGMRGVISVDTVKKLWREIIILVCVLIFVGQFFRVI